MKGVQIMFNHPITMLLLQKNLTYLIFFFCLLVGWKMVAVVYCLTAPSVMMVMAMSVTILKLKVNLKVEILSILQ